MNITKEGFLIFSSIKNSLTIRTLMYILANTDEDGGCDSRQSEMARALSTQRQAINKAIRILKEKDIFSIQIKGNGLERIYHINPEYCVTSAGYNKLKLKFDYYKNIMMEEQKDECSEKL